MEGQIRKLIVGSDPLNAMAFVVGKPTSLNNSHKIHEINFDDRHFHKTGNNRFVIKIEKENELWEWKIIENLPFIVEFNCNF